jgi:hypothetical protein
MTRRASTWVYVLEQRRGPVKVGCSFDPERRADELRYMANGTLTVAANFYRPADARAVEWIAHWLLRDHRAPHLEWFTVPAAQAIAAVERAIQMMDAGDTSDIPRARLPPSLKAKRPRQPGEPMPAKDWTAIMAEMNAWAEAHPEEMEAMLARPFIEA